MINQNLRFLRKREGLTQAQLAEKLDIKRSLIGAYEEGRAEPKLATLVNIARLFNISLDSLITNDLSTVENLPEVEQRADVKARKLRVLSITVNQDEQENIELVPQKASAGYLNGYADPVFMEDLPKFRLPMLNKMGTFRAFEISGDSMLPISSGSVIIGRYIEDWTNIKDGTPCIVVSQTEGVVFKRLYNKLNTQGLFSLHSDNPMYMPYDVNVEDILEIWESTAFISKNFPQPEMSMSKLTSMVMDLQHQVLRLKQN
ncbi:MAG: LexA family transcriptional regulator [Hymenobacteraceae bacterium]|nr:LexA family transcriptional regulator [Hymenobacteraceae bacterium]MDX5396098.1 LexA family transcriptional regulator [Hymenobacteraceae bacterium]MDX5512163.1 LexA family transcriptional regulator [Hymenobacteraceae bacterium]